MPISPVALRNSEEIQPFQNATLSSASTFAKALRNQQANLDNKTGQTGTAPPAVEPETGGNKTMQVGRISAQYPTVSQLLQSDPDFANNYWQIINSDLNKNKPFTTVRDGDILSINRQTKELSWKRPQQFKQKVPIGLLQERLKQFGRNKDATVTLGVLDKAHPTVSHVITSNHIIDGNSWDIIDAAINKDKPYATLPEGTIVEIDPDTLELHFALPSQSSGNSSPLPENAQPAAAPQQLSKLDILKIRLQNLAHEGKPVLLGTVSNSQPTVSQILKSNRHVQNLYKEIVFSDTNRNKPYRNLQPGTKVCIDPVTLELIFEKPLQHIETQNPAANAACLDKQTAEMPASERLKKYVAGIQTGPGQLISIGTISNKVPTVSQLLANDRRFSGYQWEITLAGINRDKPYTELPPGTQVSLNPENLELVFNAASQAGTTGAAQPAGPSPTAPVTHEAKPVPLPGPAKETGLTPLKENEHPAAPATGPANEEAKVQTAAENQPTAPKFVRTNQEALPLGDMLAFSAGLMVGKPSKEVNSYQLLLQGLASRGIEYKGDKGLQANLARLAVLMGEDRTALQNVDGILKIAGEPVYAKTIGPQAGKAQLAALDKEMAPHLRNGLIMTLATPTMHQSGILSSLDNKWTLINAADRLVDEVPLDKKIAELHTRAAAHNENLTVKASSLREDTLRKLKALVDLKKKEMDSTSNLARHENGSRQVP